MVTIMSRNDSFNLRARLTSVGKLEQATVVQAIFQPHLFLYKYSSSFISIILLSYKAYEDGTDRVFRNVGT